MLALLATAFVSRAAQLQIVQSERWKTQAYDQTTERVELPAARGGIYDRNGKPLALSRPRYRAFFAPTEATDRRRDATTIARVLDLSSRETSRLTDADRGWHLIGTVSGREREILAGSVSRGIHFEQVESRMYPQSGLARSLLGSVAASGRGRSGLELVLDSLLRGTPGEVLKQKDARGERYVVSTEPDAPATPGNDVFLTLDAELQEIAEQALDRALDETGSSGGDVLIADPRTGDLLAVASRRPDATASIPALSDPFEPGSTVKPFLLANLLQENLASLDDRVYAENGEYRTAYRTIRDVHPHDTLTVAEIVRFSSNIGAAKLAERIEPGLQYRYLRDFGFGTPTGLRFPGESGGLLRRPETWSALSQASLAFGYELMVTSVQLVAAYGALANDGVLLRPGLIREIRSPEGRPVWRRRIEPIRRVIRPEIAGTITHVLSSVVDEGGTGSRASLATLTVAGKTGTARIASDGGYGERRYAASFVGYIPAEQPRLVVLTKLEDPKGLYYGGRVAAPLIRTVLQDILAAPGVGIIGADLTREPRERLEWGTYRQVRESPFRLASDDGMPRAAALAAGRQQRLVLPDLTGLRVRTAAARLHQLGLQVKLECSGQVRRQTPAPGSRMVPGATVLLQ
jgi:cell division protein FtsI (penicillin-binding protein 3)